MNSPISPEIVAWVSAHMIPFEAELRAKLRRLCGSPAEIDDLVQDVYYRVLRTEAIEHIREPKAFIMQIAKNILVDRFRHESVVSIDAVANLEELSIPDNAPSTERVAQARAEWKWVVGLIANLPERCKQVFTARKIYGLSQNETAESLGISENIVEKEVIKGVKLMGEMVKYMQVDSRGQPQTAASRIRSVKKRNV